jgi:hypothetical protein
VKLPSHVGPILIIVSRHEAWLFQVFKEQFADDERVEVILDRRFRDRRRHSIAPSSERRQADRRQTDVSHALRFRGWVTAHRRDAVTSGAHHLA